MLPATEEPFMPPLRLVPSRIVLAAVLAAGLPRGLGAAEKAPPPAPPFPSARAADWIGPPASWESLRGRVVLLDVWTFACSNCRATMPWLKDVRQKYAAKGLALVGVHTPEMIFERERPKVEAEVKRQGLDYPHLLDNDSAYWNALGAQAWPTVYLVDRCGRLRDRHIGEVHSGEDSGRQVEARIEALLAEPAAACAAAAAETRR
jgi:thiol-disulfide isomerase/thioredoxin